MLNLVFHFFENFSPSPGESPARMVGGPWSRRRPPAFLRKSSPVFPISRKQGKKTSIELHSPQGGHAQADSTENGVNPSCGGKRLFQGMEFSSVLEGHPKSAKLFRIPLSVKSIESKRLHKLIPELKTNQRGSLIPSHR
jgi:hypothetical protein